jgi:hypothetical protein
MTQDYGKGGGPVSTGAKAGAKGAAAIIRSTARTIAKINQARGKGSSR